MHGHTFKRWSYTQAISASLGSLASSFCILCVFRQNDNKTIKESFPRDLLNWLNILAYTNETGNYHSKTIIIIIIIIIIIKTRR